MADKVKVTSVVTNFLMVIGLLVVLGVLLHQNDSTSAKLQTSIHENLASRVVTVTQRCYLTNLTADLAREQGDMSRYHKLVVSYDGCLHQLEKVKLELVQTPS